jgi:hypothetical protein
MSTINPAREPSNRRIAGIAKDGSTPQERAMARSALRRAANNTDTHRFTGAGGEGSDVHVTVIGPEGGSHFAGEWTLEELTSFGVACIAEAARRAGAR